MHHEICSTTPDNIDLFKRNSAFTSHDLIYIRFHRMISSSFVSVSSWALVSFSPITFHKSLLKRRLHAKKKNQIRQLDRLSGSIPSPTNRLKTSIVREYLSSPDHDLDLQNITTIVTHKCNCTCPIP